jgi:hypothetical protein
VVAAENDSCTEMVVASKVRGAHEYSQWSNRWLRSELRRRAAPEARRKDAATVVRREHRGGQRGQGSSRICSRIIILGFIIFF